VTARLGNRDDAEDVLQDMFFKIDSLATQPIAQPAAFLYRVATNLATDRRIAEGRRGARDSAWLDVQSTADEIPDAERSAIAQSELRVVQGAIDDMPERMALALRLFRIEGRAQRDIAAELGITISGVEKLLRRAYKQIQDRLSDNGAGPADLNRLSDERGT
jgi:RNA polymerase sigma factor (sigma-70 family)